MAVEYEQNACKEEVTMLVDRYAPEDVRAPEVAEQTDSVLKALDSDSGLLVDSVRVLSRHAQRAKPLIKEQVANVQALCRRRLRMARQTAQSLPGCSAKSIFLSTEKHAF